MIVIPVEVWPKGERRRARDMGTVLIWNVGGDEGQGRYGFKILKANQRRRFEELLMDPGKIPDYACWRSGTIDGFPRQTRGPLALLYRVLRHVTRFDVDP